MDHSFIVGARRTAIGRYGEALRDVPLRTLAATAIKAALEHAAVAPEAIEEVVMGNVVQAGQNGVARSAALDAGILPAATVWTINHACASGMSAISQADRMIRLGERDLLVSGGFESMSSIPFLSKSTRWGARFGHAELEDELKTGLTCHYCGLGMGETAENVARRHNITREEQDEWALRSQNGALAAIEAGRFKEEIVPIPIPQRKGDPIIFDTDEHPRQTSLEQLGKLKPAFVTDGTGTVTAGNASGINDGAAAVVVASRRAVEQHNLKPLARILSSANTGIEPEIMGLGPVLAIQEVLAKAKLQIEDIDLFEINEAFAAQVLGVLREVAIPREKLNVNGSGIALGHPVGCTGARVIVSLLHEMKQRNARYGLASVCVGGGMGAAMIVERIA